MTTYRDAIEVECRCDCDCTLTVEVDEDDRAADLVCGSCREGRHADDPEED